MSRWQDAERTAAKRAGQKNLTRPMRYMDLFPADKRLADLIEFASNIGSRRTYEEW